MQHDATKEGTMRASPSFGFPKTTKLGFHPAYQMDLDPEAEYTTLGNAVVVSADKDQARLLPSSKSNSTQQTLGLRR
jgi:hypothetical protein